MLNFAFTNLDMVYVMPQQFTPSRYTFPLSALALALASLSTQGYAADSSTTADAPQQVTVTGSRISRAQKEGATSVTVITSAELEKKGYSNAFDALNGLTQNTGFTQGADFGNTFTPAANAISLRGLGPNHTLTLIDGHRVADYPVPYDGSENFVNLANIPTAMVDRIEILNGGASAIYGSDAIAGVVNIILKKKFDGVEVNVKGGGTSHGGENLRFQLSGGKTWDDLNLVYGLEVSGRNPIWARQRDFMSDRTRLGETPTVVLGRKDAESGKYLNLGGCNSAAGLFGGSVSSIGNRCVSGKASPDFWTVQTLNQSENGYFSLDYTLNEHTQLFGNLLFGFNHTENNTRGPSWTSAANSTGYFLNQATGGYESWTKRFAPEEVGGVDHTNKEWDDTSANVNFGVRGDIGDEAAVKDAAIRLRLGQRMELAPTLTLGCRTYPGRELPRLQGTRTGAQALHQVSAIVGGHRIPHAGRIAYGLVGRHTQQTGQTVAGVLEGNMVIREPGQRKYRTRQGMRQGPTRCVIAQRFARATGLVHALTPSLFI